MPERSGEEQRRWVTLKDIDDKLEKYPTKWEVRALILIGLGLTKVGLPSTADVQSAVTSVGQHSPLLHGALQAVGLS
jgi:hypothetical protein